MGAVSVIPACIAPADRGEARPRCGGRERPERRCGTREPDRGAEERPWPPARSGPVRGGRHQARDRGQLASELARPSSSPLRAKPGVWTTSRAPAPEPRTPWSGCRSTVAVTSRMAQGAVAMMRRVASTPSITGITRRRLHVGRLQSCPGERIKAVARDPDDAAVGRGGHDAAQRLGDERDVVDDAHAGDGAVHRRARDSRSATAVMSELSVKLDLVR